jgi:hypothetical protein
VQYNSRIFLSGPGVLEIILPALLYSLSLFPFSFIFPFRFPYPFSFLFPFHFPFCFPFPCSFPALALAFALALALALALTFSLFLTLSLSLSIYLSLSFSLSIYLSLGHKNTNVPLILKVLEIIFLSGAKQIMGHFLGFFEGASTFLTPKFPFTTLRTI